MLIGAGCLLGFLLFAILFASGIAYYPIRKLSWRSLFFGWLLLTLRSDETFIPVFFDSIERQIWLNFDFFQRISWCGVSCGPRSTLLRWWIFSLSKHLPIYHPVAATRFRPWDEVEQLLYNRINLVYLLIEFITIKKIDENYIWSARGLLRDSIP